MAIFVLAEREQPIAELCGGARQFSDQVALVAIPEAAVPDGVADVIYKLEVPEGCMSEDAAPALAALLEKEQPQAVFIEPSRRMQLLIGRVAARLGVSVVSNVMEMPSATEATCMYFGGLANRKLKVATPDGKSSVEQAPASVASLGQAPSGGLFFIRPATFPDAQPSGENKEIPIAYIPPAYEVKRTKVAPRIKGNVDLSSAKRIISVGRGVKKEEDLEMVRELCSLLDAELGCSRSIYEAEEWLPKEALVGISGNTVAPDLYFTLGISGQAQHMVACDGATTIMCVNTDPYALIFDHSDYGSKADLYTVVPKMIEYFKAHPLK